jgi:stalled ribosome rescue protein Dom34
MMLQNDEDIWYFYNLIAKGDGLKMKVHRKINKGSKTEIGGGKQEKVLILMTLQIIEINF